MPFVGISGQQFSIGNAPVYLSGANCYYLAYKSRAMVDAVLDSAAAMGIGVLRTWAFLDQPKEGVVFQSWDPVAGKPVYNDGPSGLEHLDYVIYSAGLRGIRLMLPLVNNWPDFGGMDQYVSWYGLNHHAAFYSDPAIRNAYRNWATYLLTRTNTLTGIEYRHDPTIMTWELTNEARCEWGCADLTGWAGEMAAHLKSIDPNHLVAMGDEGFFRRFGSPDWTYDGSTGVDFEALLGIPEIDYGTFHMYPENWGMAEGYAGYWIQDHIDAGVRAGKPVVLEEYGWRDQSSRNSMYELWLDAMYLGGGAGDLFWMLAATQDDGSRYPDFDGFSIYAESVPAALAAHLERVRQENSAEATATS